MSRFKKAMVFERKSFNVTKQSKAHVTKDDSDDHDAQGCRKRCRGPQMVCSRNNLQSRLLARCSVKRTSTLMLEMA